MSRIFLALTRSASAAVLLLVSFPCAQLFSQTQPLGDVAREHKDTQKQLEKNGKTAKILTNDDLTQGSVTATTPVTGPPAASVEAQDPQPKESKSTASEPVVGSVLDRSKDSTPDVIIVPGGTELKVDIGDHKTVVPVRVGFATPIPALSQVTVEVTRSYVAIPHFDMPYYGGIANVDYAEYATVTAVTVNGKTYQVETNSVPLFISGTNNEVTFTLGGPVEILR
jgi:hypothetical protein